MREERPRPGIFILLILAIIILGSISGLIKSELQADGAFTGDAVLKEPTPENNSKVINVSEPSSSIEEPKFRIE